MSKAGYAIDSVWWPDCFVTGKIDNNRPEIVLCADGLMAWGNCMAGNKPTEHFGEVMVQIGQQLGILATAENLSKYADEYMPK